MKKSYYLVIGLPRGGTTVIHLLLRGHPNISALNDELKIIPFFSQGISTFTFGNDTPEEKEKGFPILFDSLSSISGSKHVLSAGAKCVCHSVAEARTAVAALKCYLKGLKIIFVVRKNLVAQFGSMISARKSGVYHSWSKDFENRKITSIKINKWIFTRYAVKCFDILQTLKELYSTHDIVECIYEDFISNPDIVYKQLTEFLNVPEIDPIWLKSQKLMPAPQDYIKNYFEMKMLLDQLFFEYEHQGLSTKRLALAKVLSLPLEYQRLNIRMVLLGLKRYFSL